jgi:hypothetical protein
LIGFAARVDEDTDDGGHVTFVDEVVKNDRDAEASVGVGMASAVLSMWREKRMASAAS